MQIHRKNKPKTLRNPKKIRQITNNKSRIMLKQNRIRQKNQVEFADEY